MIDFRSDNTAGIEAYLLTALTRVSRGTSASYGEDDVTAALAGLVSEVFERRAYVFPVVSGTAANAIGLSALCPPWGGVICHDEAHIRVNEANATAMFTGGAALLNLPGDGFLLTTAQVESFLDGAAWGDPHASQPGVLSVTQATELGAVYQPDQIGSLAQVAREWGLRMHLDGARLANAIASLGCAPADVTWRAGVEVFSLGATKNGTATADAIVTFDEDVAFELTHRLKRAGHVASKGRFMSVQLLAYLTDGRWLQSAARANAAMTRLAAGLARLGFTCTPEPAANIAFVSMPVEIASAWARAVEFYPIRTGVIRLVTSWATTTQDVDDALAALERVVASG